MAKKSRHKCRPSPEYCCPFPVAGCTSLPCSKIGAKFSGEYGWLLLTETETKVGWSGRWEQSMSTLPSWLLYFIALSIRFLRIIFNCSRSINTLAELQLMVTWIDFWMIESVYNFRVSASISERFTSSGFGLFWPSCMADHFMRLCMVLAISPILNFTWVIFSLLWLGLISPLSISSKMPSVLTSGMRKSCEMLASILSFIWLLFKRSMVLSATVISSSSFLAVTMYNDCFCNSIFSFFSTLKLWPKKKDNQNNSNDNPNCGSCMMNRLKGSSLIIARVNINKVPKKSPHPIRKNLASLYPFL